MLSNWGKKRRNKDSLFNYTWLTPALHSRLTLGRKREINLCNLLTKELSHSRVKDLFLLPANDSDIFPHLQKCVWRRLGSTGTGWEVNRSLVSRNLPSVLSGDPLGPAPGPSQQATPFFKTFLVLAAFLAILIFVFWCLLCPDLSHEVKEHLGWGGKVVPWCNEADRAGYVTTFQSIKPNILLGTTGHQRQKV